MKTKEKLLAVLLTLMVFVLAFTSCRTDENIPDDKQPPTGGNNDTVVEDFIMTQGTEIYVVLPNGMSIPSELESAIFAVTGVTPKASNGETTADHEIIIGEQKRTLADKAYRALDNMDLSQKESLYSGWVIYSDANSLAIAYDTDVSLDLAIEALIDGYISTANSKLTIASGEVARDSFDLYEKYEELSEAQREKEFATLEAYVDSLGYDGEALVKSVKQLYSLYDTNTYMWLVNLYDPSVGGFYYSNSARETVGFLPDIESTNQALNFITNTGMQSNLNKNLPTEIKEQIVSFVKGLQSSEDGYFYHPQWVDFVTTDNRRGRDLTWAEDILRRFGEKPLYDTPNGTKGTLGAPTPKSDVALTSSFRTSIASLVSKVTPTAASYLANETAFLEYIRGLGWENGSYGPGNTIAAQANQIKAAGLGSVCINFLNGLSDPETGMFEKYTGYADEAVNGFLKVSAVYVTMGVPIPNAAAAAETCIETLTSDAYCATVCFVYNVWYALDNIFGSLNGAASTAEDKAVAAEILDELRTSAAEYITVGARKYAEFRKDDGSFSYTPKETSAMSQGMPVAIQGTNEGDVNATNISVAGVTGYLFSALGYRDYMPSIYTEYDWQRFVSELSSMDAVIKTKFNMYNASDFEDVDVDQVFNSSSYTELDTDPDTLEDSKKAYAYIKEDSGNKVLHFGKLDYGYECYVGKAATGFSGKKYTLELKMKYDGSEMQDGLESWNSRFSMYYDGGRFWYVLMYPKADGTLAVGDLNQPVAVLQPGTWYTLTFEYFAEENVCHLYVNGTHIGKAGTVDTSKNDNGYARALFELRNQAKISYYFDDILVKKEDIEYVEPPLEIGDATGDFYKDIANKGTRKDYDAMFASAPALASGSKYASTYLEEGNLVFKKLNGDGESYLQYTVNANSTLTTPILIYESDIKFSNLTAENFGKIRLYSMDKEITFTTTLKDGIVTVTPINGTNTLGKKLEIPVDEWHNLRFEVDYTSSEIHLFLDNVHVTTYTNVAFTSASGSRKILLYLYTAETQGAIEMDNLFYGLVEDGSIETNLPEGPGEGGEGTGGTVLPPEVTGTENNGKGAYYSGTIAGISGVTKDYASGTAPQLEIGNSRPASAVTEIADGVLKYYKLNTDNEEYFKQSYTTPSTTLTNGVAIWEADLQFGNATEGALGRITICVGGKEVVVGLHVGADGKLYFGAEKTAAANSPALNAGKWYNVRFEYYYHEITADAPCGVVRVYVDNELSCTLTGLGVNTRSWTDVRNLIYLAAEQKSAYMFIDNLYLGFADMKRETVEDATGDYYLSDKEGTRVDYDADDAVFPSGSSTNAENQIKIQGGALVYSKVNTGSGSEGFARWNITPVENLQTPVFVFETDIKFSGLSSTTFSKILLETNGLTTQITVNHSGDKITFIPAGSGATGSVSISENAWHNVRFELDYAAKTIAVFVDNKYVSSFENVVLGPKAGYNRILFYMLAGETTGSVSFDNVYYGVLEEGSEIVIQEDDATGKYYTDDKASGTRLDYDKADATAPAIGGTDTTLGIVDGSLVLGRVEGEETYTDNGFQSMTINSFSGLTSPVLIVEADMKFEGFNAAKGTVAGWIRLFSNNLEIRILIGHDGDNIVLSAENATGTVNLSEGAWHNVRFEIDYENNDVYVFVDNVQAGVIADPLTRAASGSRKLMYYLCKDETAGKISIDNIYAGVLEDGSFTTSTPADDAGEKGAYYTDENKTGTRLDYDKTDATAPTIGGTDSTLGIVDGSLVLGRVEGEETYTDNGFKATDIAAFSGLTSPVLIVEADMKFEGFNAAKGTVAGWIRLFSNDLEIRILVGHDGDNIVFSATDATGTVSVAEGKWQNIRFEIDYENNDVYVFVDNVQAGVIADPTTIAASGSRKLMYYLCKDETAGKISIDNIYAGVLEDGSFTVAAPEKPEVKDDATGDYYLSDEAGTRVDYDAEGATVPSGSSTNAQNAIAVTNGSLVYSKVAGQTGSEGYARWNVTAVSGLTTPVFVFEMDVKFANVASTTFGKILLEANELTTQITVNHSGDKITFLPASSSATGSVSIAEDVWTNVRFELDYTEKLINVFVDNVYAGSLENVTISTKTGYNRVLFYMLSGETAASISFDNIYYGLLEDGTELPKEDATGDYYLSENKGSRVNYDIYGTAIPAFQSGSSYATLTAVDGSLEYKKTGAYGSGTESTFRWTPGCTKSSDIYVYEADMKFSNVTSTTLGWIRIAACDNYFNVTVNHKDDNIIFYVGDTAKGASIKENEWVNVRIEVDYANKLAVLCINNEFAYAWENISLTSASGSQYVRFALTSTANANDTIYFDNIFCGFVSATTQAPAAEEN